MQLLGFMIVVASYGLLMPLAEADSLPTNRTQVLLSRRRRYVAFPEGSSVSAAICMTLGVIGNSNFLSSSINWGVAYDLPTYEWAREHANGFSSETKVMAQRRSRRELYGKLELIIDKMGYPGRTCISRALCESVKFIRSLPHRKGNMVEELIKIIFRFPSHQLTTEEPEDHHHYAHVQRRARRNSNIDCELEYSECNISLLDLVLGRYSRSPTTLSFM
ncbi:uncharacterized protein LOC142219954 [Haematobia irritans]|uniref:uncharacterized protein LOC142219954 n=1 Tax=Haematobia irritans TaxID=7368 RepID=UPI003F4F8785